MEPRSHPEQKAQQSRVGRGSHIREGLLILARVAGQVTSFRPVSWDPGTLGPWDPALVAGRGPPLGSALQGALQVVWIERTALLWPAPSSPGSLRVSTHSRAAQSVCPTQCRGLFPGSRVCRLGDVDSQRPLLPLGLLEGKIAP